MLEVQDGAVHSTVISSFDLLTLEILMNFFSQVPMNVVGVVQVTSRHVTPCHWDARFSPSSEHLFYVENRMLRGILFLQRLLLFESYHDGVPDSQ